MKEKISVIVPIYKVEKYLLKCVESLINQTYKNLEIILVDDGSPDKCPQICDEYAQKDNRIKVIHKENGGLSDARNAGMKIATGEYISFIDSDDWVNTDMYQYMLKEALLHNADIVECNIYNAFEDKTEKYNTDHYAIYNNNYDIMKAYIKDYNIKTVVWNKLYKKSLIKDIPFEFGKYNEDEFFTYQVLSRANFLIHIDNYYYYYRQRSGSIMGSSYSLKKLDSLEAALIRTNFIKVNYPDLYFYQLKYTTFLCIGHYQEILKNKNLDQDKKSRKLIEKYRKKLKWKISDLKKIKFSLRVFVVLSSISLNFCANLRNLFNLGE